MPLRTAAVHPGGRRPRTAPASTGSGACRSADRPSAHVRASISGAATASTRSDVIPVRQRHTPRQSSSQARAAGEKMGPDFLEPEDLDGAQNRHPPGSCQDDGALSGYATRIRSPIGSGSRVNSAPRVVSSAYAASRSSTRRTIRVISLLNSPAGSDSGSGWIAISGIPGRRPAHPVLLPAHSSVRSTPTVRPTSRLDTVFAPCVHPSMHMPYLCPQRQVSTANGRSRIGGTRLDALSVVDIDTRTANALQPT